MKNKFILSLVLTGLVTAQSSAKFVQTVSQDGTVTAKVEKAEVVNGVVTYTVNIETRSTTGETLTKQDVVVVATPNQDGSYTVVQTTTVKDPETGATTNVDATTSQASNYVPPATALTVIPEDPATGGPPLSPG